MAWNECRNTQALGQPAGPRRRTKGSPKALGTAACYSSKQPSLETASSAEAAASSMLLLTLRNPHAVLATAFWSPRFCSGKLRVTAAPRGSRGKRKLSCHVLSRQASPPSPRHSHPHLPCTLIRGGSGSRDLPSPAHREHPPPAEADLPQGAPLPLTTSLQGPRCTHSLTPTPAECPREVQQIPWEQKEGLCLHLVSSGLLPTAVV